MPATLFPPTIEALMNEFANADHLAAHYWSKKGVSIEQEAGFVQKSDRYAAEAAEYSRMLEEECAAQGIDYAAVMRQARDRAAAPEHRQG